MIDMNMPERTHHRRTGRGRFAALAAAAIAACFAASPACASTMHGKTVVVAVTGDPAPDGNGSLRSLQSPYASDAGQAAFFSFLTDTSASPGVFYWDGISLGQIVRRGELFPSGSVFGGVIGGFGFQTPLNNLGQVAFVASVSFPENVRIFRGDGTSLVEIVRRGQAAPDTNGTFDSFGHPGLNGVGEAAFGASLTGTMDGANRGIFRGDGTLLVQIVRQNQTAPDGRSTFSTFGPSPESAGFGPEAGSLPAAISDAGDVAFYAGLTLMGDPSSPNEFGIYRGNGTELRQLQ